jgi:hypothetical protein
MATQEPRVVKKAGEGFDRPDQELPIDINYQKLAEWLVSVQLLSKAWELHVLLWQLQQLLAHSLTPSCCASSLVARVTLQIPIRPHSPFAVLLTSGCPPKAAT